MGVGLKVKDELGMGVDEIKVVVNGETIAWEVEKLQIRRPVPFALVIEGPQVTLFMGGKEISAKPWQGVIPPSLVRRGWGAQIALLASSRISSSSTASSPTPKPVNPVCVCYES